GAVGVAPDHGSRLPEVALGHEVGEGVVVGDGRVLVGSGHAVDAEPALVVEVAEAGPQPGRLDEEVEALVRVEDRVPRGVDVAADGVGDVGVDVEGGGARGPVAGALLAVDRPPREGGAGQVQLAGAVLGDGQRVVAPEQGVLGRLGQRVGERREGVGLLVPEGVPVVAATGEALRRDRPSLGTGRGLDHLEQGEPDRLLELVVAVDLDVGVVPELVEVAPLLRDQAVPAGAAGRGPRGVDLAAQGGHRVRCPSETSVSLWVLYSGTSGARMAMAVRGSPDTSGMGSLATRLDCTTMRTGSSTADTS